VGDAFTEVGAPKELVGTLVGGGAGGSTGSAVTLAARLWRASWSSRLPRGVADAVGEPFTVHDVAVVVQV